eukprot:gb/GECH01003792.1/.p1 GENE.gb/GECH01003792.1/~~gb/GECH01003792.1/.p1  ORF type:complete len:170 (+),score=25.62 gb/GECH01003792.1/:1-510(+)
MCNSVREVDGFIFYFIWDPIKLNQFFLFIRSTLYNEHWFNNLSKLEVEYYGNSDHHDTSIVIINQSINHSFHRDPNIPLVPSISYSSSSVIPLPSPLSPLLGRRRYVSTRSFPGVFIKASTVPKSISGGHVRPSHSTTTARHASSADGSLSSSSLVTTCQATRRIRSVR